MACPAIASMFHISFRVTVYTPLHPHRGNPGDSIHGFYRAVAFLTFQSRFNMPLVREVNEIRQIVYLDPWNGLTIFPVADKLQYFRPFADTRYRFVAPHALANAGNASNGCFVRVDVAVLARYLVIGCMYCVTEFDGLDGTSI